MSGSPQLERRYRRLLAFYPAAFRREHGREMLAVLMEGAAEGQRRPRIADAADLLGHAILLRLQHVLTGGVPMKTGLRGWWLSPPRSGMQRLIIPYEFRHLRAFGIMRIVGGAVAAGVGGLCLAYGGYGWAAFFLFFGALNLSGGSWYLAIARSRTFGT